MTESAPSRAEFRLRFCAFIAVAWLVAFILDGALGQRVQHIEVWWTLIVSAGLYFAMRNLITARADRLALLKRGQNGEAMLVVSFSREFELVRFIQEFFLWLVGLAALTQELSRPPPDLAFSYLVSGLLFTVGVGLSYNSWLGWEFRKDLDALVALRLPAEGREGRQRDERRDLEDRQEKEE